MSNETSTANPMGSSDYLYSYEDSNKAKERFKEKLRDIIKENDEEIKSLEVKLKSIMERNIKNMGFGGALAALQSGNKVSREGWNEKNMFIYKTVGNTVSKDFIPKFASLPESVKSFLAERGTDVIFKSSLTMYTADGEMQPGWQPSQADLLAEDWQTLN